MNGFQFDIFAQPDFAAVKIQVPSGETLKVEAGAMASMDLNFSIRAKARGGLSRFLSGESLFISEYTAQGGPAEIVVAPGAPGDIAHVFLNNQTIYLQNSSYLASHPGVKVESKWQGLTKGFFSGESFFLVKCSGTGDLWFNTYGAMIELQDVSSDLVVDTGHIVAFTEGLEYQVTKLGGYKSLFFSGEGFVCRFSGKGKVWLQTKKISHFASWLYYYRPIKKRS